jgi:hypothetical protein
MAAHSFERRRRAKAPMRKACSRAANATQYPQIIESIDSGGLPWTDAI